MTVGYQPRAALVLGLPHRSCAYWDGAKCKVATRGSVCSMPSPYNHPVLRPETFPYSPHSPRQGILATWNEGLWEKISPISDLVSFKIPREPRLEPPGDQVADG